MIAAGIILGILLSIFSSIAMWKYSHLFLSSRDYYVNSKYGLLKKRISMSLSAGGVVLFIFILLAGGMKKKNKQQNIYTNNSDTLTIAEKVKKQATKAKRMTKTKILQDTTILQTPNLDE